MCEVTLNSNCLAMSDTHAVLLHDGNRRWEILNYSQFGLEVDGIRYGLELPENDQPKIAKKQEKDPILERIHQIKVINEFDVKLMNNFIKKCKN